MSDKYITINVDKLRKDLKNESYGAFFVGGFGGALIEAGDLEMASPEELVELASQKGIDLRKYRI